MFAKERAQRSKNALPLGMVKALKNDPPRLPTDASEVAREVMGNATEKKYRIAMGLESYRQSATMLKAIESLQDDFCGPIRRDMNLTLQVTHTDLVARMEKQLGTGE